MRLTAASYQAAFDYDNAVSTYLQLYDTVKKAKRLGIKAPPPLPGEKALTLDEIGLTALFNAAFAAELNRDFKKSIDLYTQYGAVEPDHRKKDRALWEIASIYKQSGDVGNMVDTLDRWRSSYGRDPATRTTSCSRSTTPRRCSTARAATSKPRPPARRRSTRGSSAARSPRVAAPSSRASGSSKFAEDYYAKNFETYEIKKAAATPAALKAQTADLDRVRKATEDKYMALDDYQIVEDSMASLVRFGDIQYEYGQKLSNAPIPLPIQNSKNPDDVAKYETARDAALMKYLAEAKQDWAAGRSGRAARRYLEQVDPARAREPRSRVPR